MVKTETTNSQTDQRRSSTGQRSSTRSNTSNSSTNKFKSQGTCSTEASSTVPGTGESAFKTYNFDQIENDPDMEKCIQFWKKIMSNNFKPKACKCDQGPERCNVKTKSKKTTKKKLPKQEELDLNFWVEAVKQLQKRRLDQFKAQALKACNYCQKYDPEKMELCEEIKKLNEWKPMSSYADKSKKDGEQRELPKRISLSEGSKIIIGKKTTDNNDNDTDAEEKSDEVKSLESATTGTPPTPTPTTVDTLISKKSERKCGCGCEVDCCFCTQPKEVTCTCSKEKTIVKDIKRHSKKSKETITVKGDEIVTTTEHHTVKVSGEEEICCNCGCSISNCICEQLEALLQESELHCKEQEQERKAKCLREKPKRKFEKTVRKKSSANEILFEELDDESGKCNCGCEIAFCVCEKITGLETPHTPLCVCKKELADKPNEMDIADDVCKCGCGIECCPCSMSQRKLCKCFFKDMSESCASLKSFEDHTIGLQCTFIEPKQCMVCKS